MLPGVRRLTGEKTKVGEEKKITGENNKRPEKKPPIYRIALFEDMWTNSGEILFHFLIKNVRKLIFFSDSFSLPVFFNKMYVV